MYIKTQGPFSALTCSAALMLRRYASIGLGHTQTAGQQINFLDALVPQMNNLFLLDDERNFTKTGFVCNGYLVLPKEEKDLNSFFGNLMRLRPMIMIG
jgi:hypothetical protein